MCGILAVLLADEEDCVNQLLFDGLTVLQHRGQDAAGMATCCRGNVHIRKANGLVKDVFEQTHMVRLSGNVGIGHTRYPTAGSSCSEEAQPLYTSYPYGLCCAHNGNLTNVSDLQKLCASANRHINTQSDSELLLNAFAEELSRVMPRDSLLGAEAVFDAVKALLGLTRGGYSVVVLITGVGVVAFRDIYGIRPLVIGSRPSQSAAGRVDWLAASESVAMDALGFDLNRDVEPGEAVFFDSRSNTMSARQCYNKPGVEVKLSPCVFEFVYFARPDSRMDGVSVYDARASMGRALARKVQRQCPDWESIDVVIPIPDTSRTAAIETAWALGKPFREAFQKNRYIARTFIMPGQNVRKKTVRLKLNTIKQEFKGRTVLLVDDSIVRGTTSCEIIQMAKEAGAARVFFASASPPVRFPNVYGIDLPSRTELIAADREDNEIARLIGADQLIYQDLEDMLDSVRSLNPGRLKFGFEASVFDGHYITGDVGQAYFMRKSRASSFSSAEEHLMSSLRPQAQEVDSCGRMPSFELSVEELDRNGLAASLAARFQNNTSSASLAEFASSNSSESPHNKLGLKKNLSFAVLVEVPSCSFAGGAFSEGAFPRPRELNPWSVAGRRDVGDDDESS